VTEHRRPDIVVVAKDNKTVLLVDIAMPGDTRIEEKELKVINTRIWHWNSRGFGM